MKKQPILKLAMCVAAFSAFALSSSANAQVVNQNEVVNIQVGYGSTTNNPYPGISMSGYGYAKTGTMVDNATPMAFNGNTWNQPVAIPYPGPSQSSESNLLYSTGVASGINWAITPGLVTSQESLPYSVQGLMPLMSNLSTSYPLDSGSIIFSGLNNSAKYDITIEAYSGGYFGTTFALGLNSQSIGGSHTYDFAPWSLDGNYVEFNNISPTGGEITITEAVGNGGQLPSLSGLQIGEVVSAPEPSSTALLVLGAGALGFMMVRRAKSGRSLS